MAAKNQKVEDAAVAANQARNAKIEDEKARALDLSERRKKAEAEAAAIRKMMSEPGKKLPPKKVEEVKPAEPAKAGIKGDLAQACGHCQAGNHNLTGSARRW